MSAVISTIDRGFVGVGEWVTRDETVLFAAADDWAAGTILARKTVSDTITSTVTGTGTRTRAPAAIAGRTLQTGTYTVVAGTLTSGVGTFTCTAPNGETETCAVGTAGADWTFPRLGLFVDIGSGTEFVTSDSIAIVVSAQSGTPLTLYSATGTNGAQTPKAVLPYALSRASGGSSLASVIVSGKVNKSRLVIDAGGSITTPLMDLLAAAGITVVDVNDLSILDNGAT